MFLWDYVSLYLYLVKTPVLRYSIISSCIFSAHLSKLLVLQISSTRFYFTYIRWKNMVWNLLLSRCCWASACINVCQRGCWWGIVATNKGPQVPICGKAFPRQHHFIVSRWQRDQTKMYFISLSVQYCIYAEHNICGALLHLHKGEVKISGWNIDSSK